MKSTPKFILSACGLALLGSVLGYAISSQQAELFPKKTSNDPGLTTIRSQRPTSERDTAARQVSRIASLTSDRERTRAALQLAETIPLSQIRAWLDENRFTHRDGFAFLAFRKVLLARWQQEAPTDYLLWTLETGEELSEADYATLANLTGSERELLGKSLDQLSIGTAFTHLAEIAQANGEIALELYIDGLKKGRVLKSDRDFAKEAVLFSIFSLVSSDAFESEMEKVPIREGDLVRSPWIRDRLRNHFSETLIDLQQRVGGHQALSSVMRAASDRPDELFTEIDGFSPVWKDQLVRELSQVRPNNVADFKKWLAYDWDAVSETKPGEPSALLQLLTANLSNHLETAVVHLDRLSLEERTEFLSAYANSYGGQKEEGRAKILALLPGEDDRNILQDQWARNDDPGIGRIRNSDEFLSRAQALANSSAGQTSPEEIHQLQSATSWLSNDEKQKLANTFDTAEGAAKDQLAVSLAGVPNGRYIGMKQKGLALRHLAESEQARQVAGLSSSELIELTSRHTVQFLADDAPAAADFTASLPPGDTRDWATRNLYTNWQKLDPPAAATWFRNQPAEVRATLKANQ